MLQYEISGVLTISDTAQTATAAASGAGDDKTSLRYKGVHIATVGKPICREKTAGQKPVNIGEHT